MSRDYDRIIEFENENSGLDFKAIQYDKNRHAELLKDIVAMANADVDGERLIIIGVKHKPNGEREIRPIQDEKFVDAANYQQLIRENVEPDLIINYEPHRHKEKLIGLLKIHHCDDPPYMLKKDFRDLKRGDCYVRKGSHQLKASRPDLDRLYEYQRKKSEFSGKIDIGFYGTEYCKEITAPSVGNIELPSQKAARKIRRILSEKKKQAKHLGHAGLMATNVLEAFSISPFGGVPYEKRSIETLEKDLAEVKETYCEDDKYALLEVHAFRLNFELFNNADEYLQDATVLVELTKDDSFFVSNHIMEEPRNDYFLLRGPIVHSLILNYPNVEHAGQKISISNHIGDVKHQMKTQFFEEDIRLTIFRKPDSGGIPLTIKLYGKNVATPIERQLRINIIESETEPDASADS